MIITHVHFAYDFIAGGAITKGGYTLVTLSRTITS
jgi:hypothetical protein